jgi:hypothetical protein
MLSADYSFSQPSLAEPAFYKCEFEPAQNEILEMKMAARNFETWLSRKHCDAYVPTDKQSVTTSIS